MSEQEPLEPKAWMKDDGEFTQAQLIKEFQTPIKDVGQYPVGQGPMRRPFTQLEGAIIRDLETQFSDATSNDQNLDLPDSSSNEIELGKEPLGLVEQSAMGQQLIDQIDDLFVRDPRVIRTSNEAEISTQKMHLVRDNNPEAFEQLQGLDMVYLELSHEQVSDTKPANLEAVIEFVTEQTRIQMHVYKGAIARIVTRLDENGETVPGSLSKDPVCASDVAEVFDLLEKLRKSVQQDH